jgi:hypothetical protein
MVNKKPGELKVWIKVLLHLFLSEAVKALMVSHERVGGQSINT